MNKYTLYSTKHRHVYNSSYLLNQTLAKSFAEKAAALRVSEGADKYEGKEYQISGSLS